MNDDDELDAYEQAIAAEQGDQLAQVETYIDEIRTKRYAASLYKMAHDPDGRVVLYELMRLFDQTITPGQSADYHLGRRSVSRSIRGDLQRFERLLPAQMEIECETPLINRRISMMAAEDRSGQRGT